MKLLPLSFLLFISLIPTVSASGGGGGGSSPFIPLNPPIVVNIMDGQRIRHMQVMVELKVPNSDNAKKVEFHKGAIRHELILLLSSQDVTTISSSQGKEQLRKEALSAVQKTINELEGVSTPEKEAEAGTEASTPNETAQLIEALYFTNFIIQ